jgi:amidohydrolase
MYFFKKHINMTNSKFDLSKIIALRHELHQNPELSDNEFITAERIVNFLAHLKPHKLIRGIGGNGIACIFKGEETGASVLFRCDMDALPIDEENDFEHKSIIKGVSHKCGHDGHMAIMAGLADLFSKKRPKKGQVILLFQPSEENGKGALNILNDEKFKSLKLDYVFALHNLPGFPLGSIILRKDAFASASKGMIIKLYGKTSHAAEPENGISPAIAMADIIKELNDAPNLKNIFSDHTLVTVVHAQLGEVAFGTSPGFAQIMATLRTFTNVDMQKLASESERLIKKIATANNLRVEISYTEEFPASTNNNELVTLVEKVAQSCNTNFQYIKQPFRWSEDFAHFTEKFPGVLFGLGSGIDCAQLHNPDYDFPDEIIESGVKIFSEIHNQIKINKKIFLK